MTWWHPAEPSRADLSAIEASLRRLRPGQPIRSSFEVKQLVAGARRDLAGLLIIPAGSSEQLVEERITRPGRAIMAAIHTEARLQEEYELTRQRERSGAVRRQLVDQLVASFKAQIDANPQLRRVLRNVHSPYRTAYPDAYIFGTLEVMRRVPNPARNPYERDRDLRRTEGMGIAEPRRPGELPPAASIEVPALESVLLLRLDWESSQLSNEARPEEQSALERALAKVGLVLDIVLSAALFIDGYFLLRYAAARTVSWVARAGAAGARRAAVAELDVELAAARSVASDSRGLTATATGDRLAATRELQAGRGAEAPGGGFRGAQSAVARAATPVARAATQARDAEALAARLAELAPNVPVHFRRRAAKEVSKSRTIATDDDTLRAMTNIFARTGREEGARVQIRAASGELAVLRQLDKKAAVQRIQAIAAGPGARTPDFVVTLANGEVRVVQLEVRTLTRARKVDPTRPRGIELPPELRGAPARAPRGAPHSDQAILDAFRAKFKRGQISENGVVAVHLTFAPAEGTELLSARVLDAINVAASSRPEILELWLSVPTKAGRRLWRIDRNPSSLNLVDRWPALPTAP